MPRIVWLWLIPTTLLAMVLWGVANQRGDSAAWSGIGMGVGVSLITLVASKTSAVLASARLSPISRLLFETCVRLMLPLSFLLAMAIAKRDLLTDMFLLYFLPFQLLTIVVGAAASIHKIDRQA